jgi:aryl-alcohol dehydrogenase-like predicted oxidoreductase
MEYRKLGSSGLKVSVIGLGGNTFGRYADEQQTAAIINRALDLGVNFIDTADIYGRGVSEEFVGKAVRERRREALIATKVCGRMGDLPNDQGLSRAHIMDGAEASLRRLGTDYIDLYQVHFPDPDTPIEETLRALDDLVHQGKVRYIGCSNFAAWQICEALWVSDRHHLASFVSVQPQYNLLNRTIERELLPFCRRFGIGIIPYSPLAGGLLTGKYRLGEPPPPGTRAYNNPNMQRQLTEQNLRIVERLSAFAQARGHTVGELALAWLAAHPEVSTIIAGATSPEQVEQNVKAADWKLTGDELKEIEALLAG